MQATDNCMGRSELRRGIKDHLNSGMGTANDNDKSLLGLNNKALFNVLQQPGRVEMLLQLDRFIYADYLRALSIVCNVEGI